MDNGDGTGQFCWQTTGEDIGSYSDVKFEVIDSSSLRDYELITITVGDFNQPPVLDPIGDQPLEPGELYTLHISATGPDGDALTFKATNLPIGAVFTDNGDDTASFTWTPVSELAGNFLVTFMATDLGDPPASASDEVAITVRGVCEMPEAPEGLKVKSTRKRVTLRWDYEDEFDYFNIYRCVDNAPPCDDDDPYATSTVTSYTDRNLPNDFNQIVYYVTAVDACGESDPSNTVTVRPKGR